MQNYTVRRAHPKDIDAIVELETLCFARPWSRNAFLHDIVNNPLARYFVAEKEENILAYGGIWLIAPEGHITNIAVHPDYRKKGIGKALLAHIIEKSEAEGMMRHTLEVRVNNHSAIALYRSFGFYEGGIRKNYYDDTNEDALIMWRDSADILKRKL